MPTPQGWLQGGHRSIATGTAQASTKVLSVNLTVPGLFTRSRDRSRGQSLVEFTLFVPILLMLFLGIVDLGRGFTTAIAIESAAREAADWGSFDANRWSTVGSPPVYEATVAQMEKVACTAASDVPDFAGSSSTCSNPSFECELQLPGGGTQSCSAASPCSAIVGDDVTPCKVTVTMSHTFNLILPVQLLGLPPSILIERPSTFAVADCKEGNCVAP